MKMSGKKKNLTSELNQIRKTLIVQVLMKCHLWWTVCKCKCKHFYLFFCQQLSSSMWIWPLWNQCDSLPIRSEAEGSLFMFWSTTVCCLRIGLTFIPHLNVPLCSPAQLEPCWSLRDKQKMGSSSTFASTTSATSCWPTYCWTSWGSRVNMANAPGLSTCPLRRTTQESCSWTTWTGGTTFNGRNSLFADPQSNHSAAQTHVRFQVRWSAFPHPQEALQFPWCICSEQTGAGSLHLLPAGADDCWWVPSDRQRRWPRHGWHRAVRQPVEPRAGGKEACGQDTVQGNVYPLKIFVGFGFQSTLSATSSCLQLAFLLSLIISLLWYLQNTLMEILWI